MFRLSRQLMFAGLLALPIALVAGQAAQAQDRFGAISYSASDGADGYSYNYASRSAAEDRALSECRGYGGTDCQVLVWFRNACGAMAVSSSGAYGSGWGTTTGLAESAALGSCERSGASCQIKRWVCTDR
ncbi:MAG: DUF4189 domain-containing protein [Aphanocapsa sp. GSE-SYN-MK-11-07L]|nr:DUF4189 domain-containing protein [Aphanocapsa sp. GSE-SYN-MK-11-07L]